MKVVCHKFLEKVVIIICLSQLTNQRVSTVAKFSKDVKILVSESSHSFFYITVDQA